MSVLMRRENTLIIEPGSDISKIQIINFILLPNSKKHFEGPPLQKMLKNCLKVVRCYINTKQRCHLYLSVSSCFPLLKSFQLTRQICYNKEITLKRYRRVASPPKIDRFYIYDFFLPAGDQIEANLTIIISLVLRLYLIIPSHISQKSTNSKNSDMLPQTNLNNQHRLQ
ncbi:Hypothetical_protein [Hexamita inflata]|uniref:Hypothetical_protein n=1 Tax=Hexamita inflata TaxID=28002 RepID=A0AA86QB09_9EUKA|nr:Hypothetical protein HINF_LOCUS43341 [Hexamita inflata]